MMLSWIWILLIGGLVLTIGVAIITELDVSDRNWRSYDYLRERFKDNAEMLKFLGFTNA